MSGEEPKQLEDFTEEVKSTLPGMVDLGKQDGQHLDQALEKMLALEKKTRLAADARSTAEITVAIIRLLRELNRWTMLNEHIVMIAKKRSQLKRAIINMVQEAMTYVDATPDKATQMALIDTLRTVTAGKIFVEVERARVTMTLAKIKENEGAVSEAAEVLQEIQVETIGSMERREKAEFILEQQRLCLARQDFVRAQIMSRKINNKTLNDPDFQDIRVRFYQQQILYFSHFNNYMEMCKSFRAIYDTPVVQQNDDQWKEALRNACLSVILAPHDNEQHDMLHRLYSNKHLEQLPFYKNLLKIFTLIELIQWPISNLDQLRQEKTFEHNAEQRMKDLQSRTVEHNIRVISSYYQRISTQRLSQLLHLSPEETERFLSDMVSSKTIFAKIDRPANVVVFTKPRDANDLLNDWGHDISQLLNLVEKTVHLINRENMVHKIQ